MVIPINLNLPLPDSKYKSPSQQAGNSSEAWFSTNMYCPCCLNEKVAKFRNNQKATDFLCEICRNDFQLKASKTRFGKRVNDGAYKTMMQFILSNQTPNFFLMHYSKNEWAVKNLFFIPKFFISASNIEKRSTLSPTADRAGWTGCYIIIERIPETGRIPIIREEKVMDKTEVHKTWRRMFFLNIAKPESKGWTADILKCIEELKKDEFTLDEIYKFEPYLSEIHPDNNHVKDKIRQQLQVLRDNQILRFKAPGLYEII
ncbi:MAG: DpnI domain-containing protein [Candidatus Bilamarchaeaceae archaeon]